jgi:hypothetical protein
MPQKRNSTFTSLSTRKGSSAPDIHGSMRSITATRVRTSTPACTGRTSQTEIVDNGIRVGSYDYPMAAKQSSNQRDDRGTVTIADFVSASSEVLLVPGLSIRGPWAETANSCRVVAERSLNVAVPRLEGRVARIAKLADPPDLGFKIVDFKTFLFASKDNRFTREKCDSFAATSRSRSASKIPVTPAQILVHRRARLRYYDS